MASILHRHRQHQFDVSSDAKSNSNVSSTLLTTSYIAAQSLLISGALTQQNFGRDQEATSTDIEPFPVTSLEANYRSMFDNKYSKIPTALRNSVAELDPDRIKKEMFKLKKSQMKEVKNSDILHKVWESAFKANRFTDIPEILDDLSNFSNINQLDERGRTLMHRFRLSTTPTNIEEILDVLINNKIDLRIVDEDGFSGLYTLVSKYPKYFEANAIQKKYGITDDQINKVKAEKQLEERLDLADKNSQLNQELKLELELEADKTKNVAPNQGWDPTENLSPRQPQGQRAQSRFKKIISKGRKLLFDRPDHPTEGIAPIDRPTEGIAPRQKRDRVVYG